MRSKPAKPSPPRRKNARCQASELIVAPSLATVATADIVPEVRQLTEPGYLFAGPVFNLGPYGPGPVVFRLDAYNPREPHEFFTTATYRVSGTYPLWTIGFEDADDADFDDIILSVEAVPAPPEETVVIRPVDGSFMVALLNTGDHLLALEIGVFDEAGDPLPNRTVDLSLAAVEGTGGHIHTAPTTAAALGELSETTVNTGAGTVIVTYQAGVASGDRELRGTSPGATEVVTTIAVAVGDLVQLLPGANYGLIGAACCPHHSVNHFGTPGFVTALQDLADSFFGEYDAPLEFNDMSLVTGGVFDIDQNYMSPHDEHLIGTNVDLRTKFFQPRQLKFIHDEWEELGGTVHDETIDEDGTPAAEPHYHLRF